jgi:hypothetical protein
VQTLPSPLPHDSGFCIDEVVFDSTHTHTKHIKPPQMHVLKLERVQTRTTTIYTETKINIKMPRNGFRMHLPRATTT